MVMIHGLAVAFAAVVHPVVVAALICVFPKRIILTLSIFVRGFCLFIR
jgi:hypothetical protein